MASGSSSSMPFVGTTGTSDGMELLQNCQQESNQQNLVVAVSPTTLLDINRYVCEVCFKGFPRKQNLSLHRRAHNLPFTLKTRTATNEHVPKKVYVCPEPTCVHHNRSHAIGDFGGLKKHYLRRHCTEKKYKCDICSKAYSVGTDLKAHSKICARKNQFGSEFSRSINFTSHLENYGAAKNPHTLDMGDSLVKTSSNNNNVIIPIGSTMSYPQTFGLGDNIINVNSNENSRTVIGPPVWSIQNQSNSYPFITPYQSQSCQFGADHSSLMSDHLMGFNFNESIPPAFFSPSSTQQNQQGWQEDYDIGFYADLLTDKIPLENVNLEDMSLMRDYGNAYGIGPGLKSCLGGGFMLDPSSSLKFAPAMYDFSLNGMLNPVTGSSDGGRYEQADYHGYRVQSGHSFNFEHEQQQHQKDY